MRTLAIACVALFAGAVSLAADDMNVQADPRADFPSFKTFNLRNASITSERPELDNRLFEKKLPGSKLVVKLPDDAQKLIAKYPKLGK